MKKIFSLLFLVVILIPFFSSVGQAMAPPCDPTMQLCEEIGGWVPCGRETDENGIVAVPCQPAHIFIMIQRIYRDLIVIFAIPLATILVVAGGIIWMLSAGNPGQLSFGKQLFKGAAWGLGLCLLSWLIIDVTLKAIGYNAEWFKINWLG